MIVDMYTIIWKEAKELLQQRGRMRGGLIGMLFFIGIFGILMPIQTGREWVSSPIGLFYWSWIPFLLVSSVIADSFAGERERHTLETLLASRLSDRAILFGKIAAAMAYGWGITVTSILLSLVTVNLVHGRGELLLYPFEIGLSILALSFLIAWLAAGLGVLVSLRAATVRQAQQTFSIAFILLFIPLFLLPLLPEEWQIRLAQVLRVANLEAIVLTAVGILLLANLALLAAAMARFKRAHLVID